MSCETSSRSELESEEVLLRVSESSAIVWPLSLSLVPVGAEAMEQLI